MCLIKKYKYPLFTIFPKIVYKRICWDRDNKFYTPIMFNYIEFGKTYIGKSYNYKNNIKEAIHDKELNEGFIHCYKSYSKALKMSYLGEYVAKCVIPAFTFYFIGTEGEIATRKLKYVKIIM